jgi:hypothetical protein
MDSDWIVLLAIVILNSNEVNSFPRIVPQPATATEGTVAVDV